MLTTKQKSNQTNNYPDNCLYLSIKKGQGRLLDLETIKWKVRCPSRHHGGLKNFYSKVCTVEFAVYVPRSTFFCVVGQQ